MSTLIGIGKSKLIDTVSAAKETVRGALSTLEGKKPDIIFVYATFGYEFQDLIKSIKLESGGAFVVGGSVFGIIDKEGGDTELNRVMVCAISSDDFKMTPVMAKGLSAGSGAVGINIKNEILGKNILDIKGLYLVVDGLHISDPDSMLREISTSLPKEAAIFGGSAAEPLLWKNTYQFFDDAVYEDSVVGVIFSGHITIDVTSSHGSQELGGFHVVTRANGPKIFEIDNKPAMNLFSELYGSEQKEINAMTAAGVCLGTKIYTKEGKDEHLELRIPLSSDKDGSIIMAAAWSEGTKIFICQRNVELISKRNLEVISELLLRHEGKTPVLVFEADCLGRSADQIGKDDAAQDILSSVNAFRGEPLWFGAYFYGELASVEEIAAFHNWTGAFACFYLD